MLSLLSQSHSEGGGTVVLAKKNKIAGYPEGYCACLPKKYPMPFAISQEILFLDGYAGKRGGAGKNCPINLSFPEFIQYSKCANVCCAYSMPLGTS